MIKISICDDDALCLQNINEAVSRWALQNKVQVCVESFDNGDRLLEHCKREHTDIILLDIIMPLLNGMDVAREIRESDRNTKIVFLTLSSEFAIESYDVEAAGYLLKPVNEARLFALLNKCLNEANRPMDSITLHTISGYQNVYLHNIEYLEAQNKKVIIALNDGSRLETASTLSFYEKQLTIDKGFFKCHRSYIVYMPAIDHFNNNEIITKTGVKLSISRGLGKMLQDTYFTYMFSE